MIKKILNTFEKIFKYKMNAQYIFIYTKIHLTLLSFSAAIMNSKTCVQ
jgi:hypothetical protein